MREKKTYRVIHNDRPAEPWGQPNEGGRVLTAKPGKGNLPAQAYIDWGEYETWELCSHLTVMGGYGWDDIRETLQKEAKSYL